MEYASIEREIHVAASPEVVYEVISSPEHMQEWWPDEADFDRMPGGTGTLTWGGTEVVPITVLEAEPPRLFSFRWVHPEGEVPTSTNSFLVTFELAPAGAGTVVRLRETGFRERGWEAAVLEEHYHDHVTGWDHYLPRLEQYVARLVSS